MAITTYATLKTAVADFMHRDDLTSHIDTFIDLAEARMNRELRMSEMETRATATATGEYVALPTGTIGVRNIQVNGSVTYSLEYKTPAQMDAGNGSEAGQPRFYSIIGNEFQFYPVPSSTEIEITYYKAITPLDDTNTTNFLLTSNPEVYLHGCLVYANVFTQGDPSLHESEFSRIMESLNRTSTRKKFSGAPLQVRTA
jgi:hypothetical protein